MPIKKIQIDGYRIISSEEKNDLRDSSDSLETCDLFASDSSAKVQAINCKYQTQQIHGEFEYNLGYQVGASYSTKFYARIVFSTKELAEKFHSDYKSKLQSLSFLDRFGIDDKHFGCSDNVISFHDKTAFSRAFDLLGEDEICPLSTLQEYRSISSSFLSLRTPQTRAEKLALQEKKESARKEYIQWREKESTKTDSSLELRRAEIARKAEIAQKAEIARKQELAQRASTEGSHLQATLDEQLFTADSSAIIGLLEQGANIDAINAKEFRSFFSSEPKKSLLSRLCLEYHQETNELKKEELLNVITNVIERGADLSNALYFCTKNSSQVLLTHILSADKERVTKALNFKVSGNYVLKTAIENNASKEIIDLLIQHGANPRKCDSSDNSLLHILISSDNREYSTSLFLYYLNQNPELKDLPDSYGRTPLMKALYDGNTELFDLLIQKNVNITFKDKSDHDVFYYAQNALGGQEKRKMFIERLTALMKEEKQTTAAIEPHAILEKTQEILLPQQSAVSLVQSTPSPTLVDYQISKTTLLGDLITFEIIFEHEESQLSKVSYTESGGFLTLYGQFTESQLDEIKLYSFSDVRIDSDNITIRSNTPLKDALKLFLDILEKVIKPFTHIRKILEEDGFPLPKKEITNNPLSRVTPPKIDEIIAPRPAQNVTIEFENYQGMIQRYPVAAYAAVHASSWTIAREVAGWVREQSQPITYQSVLAYYKKIQPKTGNPKIFDVDFRALTQILATIGPICTPEKIKELIPESLEIRDSVYGVSIRFETNKLAQIQGLLENNGFIISDTQPLRESRTQSLMWIVGASNFYPALEEDLRSRDSMQNYWVQRNAIANKRLPLSDFSDSERKRQLATIRFVHEARLEQKEKEQSCSKSLTSAGLFANPRKEDSDLTKVLDSSVSKTL